MAKWKKLNKFEFKFVTQDEPLGDGHAILCAKEFLGKEPCLVIFGDDLIDAEVSCAKQLKEVFEDENYPVVALEEVPSAEVSKYGIVGGERIKEHIYGLNSFIEKPEPQNAPSNLAIVGKYLITAEVIEYLEKVPKREGKEIRLIDAFVLMAAEGLEIRGLKFLGERFDVGSKLGYLKAIAHFGLQDEEVGEEFGDYLKNL